MIQRIQSLFLLGVVIISTALFFVPLSEKTYIDSVSGSETKLELYVTKSISVTGTEKATIGNNIPLTIVNLLILLASLFIIFQFKNRISQMKLSMLTSLFTMVFLILVFYYSEAMGPETSKAHYLPGVYLIAVQVFLLLAARRFIRKDEMLVRSADRIR
ncbi:MAG TPA: DUF4293 domain-containing protein [Bacteroidia bacterium]|nr:DUF4293 domain-containing protein [Bacteroidia bacterium]